MSDTTELEEHIKTQRKEYESLKKEIEIIRSENVTNEYIETKWEELKRQNKVVSPPDTPSPPKKSNSEPNQSPNSDPVVNILDMDEYMKRFQKQEISNQSNLEQSEQSNLDQSECCNIDQSECCNIDQSEAMEVEITEDKNEEAISEEKTANLVEYETSNECDTNENIMSSQSEDKSPKNEEKCQTPMEIEETIETEVDESNVSNHDNGSGTSLKEDQSIFDDDSEPILNDDFDNNVELKNEVLDQITSPQDVDIKEVNLDQSEPSILDQSEPSILDQSEPSSVDQSEPSSVDKTEFIRKDKKDIKKEITPIKRTSSRSGVKSIMTLWNFVANHRYSNLFLQKVTDEMAPGYSSVVYRTSDLSKLRMLIENGNLEDSIHFQHEMMLMFTNALFFNSADDDISRFTLEIFDDYLAEQQRCIDADLMPGSNFVEFQMAGVEDSVSSVVEPRSSRSRDLSAPSAKRRRQH